MLVSESACMLPPLGGTLVGGITSGATIALLRGLSYRWGP